MFVRKLLSIILIALLPLTSTVLVSCAKNEAGDPIQKYSAATTGSKGSDKLRKGSGNNNAANTTDDRLIGTWDAPLFKATWEFKETGDLTITYKDGAEKGTAETLRYSLADDRLIVKGAGQEFDYAISFNSDDEIEITDSKVKIPATLERLE
ncbi:MAG TPA: hypothetical protein VGK02_03155 [Candidatus Aquicultor sp.]